jgi:flotillin
MGIIGIAVVLLIFAAIAATIAVDNLTEICQPSEVLVFSGTRSKRGYEVIHSGRRLRIPLFNEVDRLDVTNMAIDLNVTNAYSKGGIPLTLRGVANVKIGTREPLINNAIERFLGNTRAQIMEVAKETLEGNLRGVLATLTPEQVNNDRAVFAQELIEEAVHDMSKLGLELDTLKIQSVSDDVGYLDAIGRCKTAELLRDSRIAEARNRAEAVVRDAENQLKRATAKINAQTDIAEAEAKRRIVDAQTKGTAMIAEERSRIGAAIAKAEASKDVQRQRLEQVRRQLQADVIKPADARKAELENQAKANAAKIIEDGKANVEALRELLATWGEAGDAARPIFLLQNFDTIFDNMLSTVEDIQIDKITVIDSQLDQVDRHGSAPLKAASGSEQIKQTLGIDLPRLLQGVSALSEKQ